MPDWVVFIIQVWSIVTISFLLWKWRRTMRERDEARSYAIGAITFANLLAERGVHFYCDDCGNELTPDDAIDVIEKDDGTMYVGHRTHNRRHDWGKV